MKLLGKLNARSLLVGDIIEVSGVVSKIESISFEGMLVSIETDMFHPFNLCCFEKVKVYSSLGE